jgi:hypothetical protein
MTKAPISADAAAIEIRLSLAPEWPKADAVAVLAKTAAAAAYALPELSEDVGVVAGELVENAVKYGDWSGTATLTFSFFSDDDQLEIEVSSPCDVTSPHYQRLLASLRTIERANPSDPYLERFSQIARDRKERGGLGLLRLLHVANCRLSARLAEDNRLHVRARMTISR